MELSTFLETLLNPHRMSSIIIPPRSEEKVPHSNAGAGVAASACGTGNAYAYEAAGGHKIINEGQQNITFFSQGGDLNTMGLQAADVNKPFGSVAELVDAGHRVAFGKAGAYIENVHGETHTFAKEQ